MRARAAAWILAAVLLGGCGKAPAYNGWPMDPVVAAPDVPLHGADTTSFSFARTGGN